MEKNEVKVKCFTQINLAAGVQKALVVALNYFLENAPADTQDLSDEDWKQIEDLKEKLRVKL